MSSIKDQIVCSRGQVILTKTLMNGKGTEFDISHLHIAQDVVFRVWPPHVGGLLQALPMYTFGHHRAPGQRSRPSRPRYLKGTMHML
jgi:hypothetical protein